MPSTHSCKYILVILAFIFFMSHIHKSVTLASLEGSEGGVSRLLLLRATGDPELARPLAVGSCSFTGSQGL